MFFARKWLQWFLGTCWLIDGLLQSQPQMLTVNMVNGVMKPILQGQPGFFEPALQLTAVQTTLHLVIINLLIAAVQIVLGFGFLFFSERWLKQVVILSIAWALIAWKGGEGISLFLTEQSGILASAPAGVLLYLFLGLMIYPREHASTRFLKS